MHTENVPQNDVNEKTRLLGMAIGQINNLGMKAGFWRLGCGFESIAAPCNRPRNSARKRKEQDNWIWPCTLQLCGASWGWHVSGVAHFMRRWHVPGGGGFTLVLAWSLLVGVASMWAGVESQRSCQAWTTVCSNTTWRLFLIFWIRHNLGMNIGFVSVKRVYSAVQQMVTSQNAYLVDKKNRVQHVSFCSKVYLKTRTEFSTWRLLLLYVWSGCAWINKENVVTLPFAHFCFICTKAFTDFVLLILIGVL